MGLENTLLGAQVTQIDTDGIARFELGTKHKDEDGTTYMYIGTTIALTQYLMYAIDETYYVLAAASNETHGANVRALGVPQSTFAAPSGTTYNYGWVAIAGPFTCTAVSGTAVNLRMALSSNAGVVASYASGLHQIDGFKLTASVAHGASASAACFAVTPMVTGEETN